MLSKLTVNSLQFAFLVLVLATFGWTNRILAQTQEVIDGARKEGQLVFYSGIPIPDAQAILTALEKKYPFIKTTFYRVLTGPARVVANPNRAARRHAHLGRDELHGFRALRSS